MAASVAWWAHIGGFVFGALVALVARHAQTAPVAPAPASMPAPGPAPVWRHANGWRVPDVRQRFPAAVDEHRRRI
jgi:hypothetical protein